MEDPDELLAAILAWARADDRVEVVVQTGSRGRGSGVDAYSDLDIELIGARWRELVADPDWSGAFAPVLVQVVSGPEDGGTEGGGPGPADGTDGHAPADGDGGGNVPAAAHEQEDEDEDEAWASRLVVYARGRKVDFSLAGPERLARRARGLDALYERGYRVLLDKTGAAAALPAATGRAPAPPRPDRAAFDEALDEFWFEATQVAVYLARGDLWVVKARDVTMKEYLLEMLEWYAATEPGRPRDTWHLGHHMDRWLPQRMWRAVQETYGRFDAADSRRALHATIGVFREASETVAARCGFPPRTELAEQVSAHIDRLTGDPADPADPAGPANPADPADTAATGRASGTAGPADTAGTAGKADTTGTADRAEARA